MSQASFFESLQGHQNSIYAIVLRDMHSKFASSRFGFLMNLFEPITMIVTIYLIRRFLRGTPMTHGVPVAVFLTSGYLVHYSFRNMMTEISGAVQRTSHLLAFPNITVVDNILGRAVTVWMTYSCVNVILSTMAVTITNAPLPNNVLLIISGYYGGMWIGFSAGILLGTAIRFLPILRYLVSPVMRFSIFFSGAMFSAAEIPKWLLPYLAWNPVFHSTEILREGWTATYISPIANQPYLYICCVIGTAIALTVERLTRHIKIT